MHEVKPKELTVIFTDALSLRGICGETFINELTVIFTDALSLHEKRSGVLSSQAILRITCSLSTDVFQESVPDKVSSFYTILSLHVVVLVVECFT